MAAVKLERCAPSVLRPGDVFYGPTGRQRGYARWQLVIACLTVHSVPFDVGTTNKTTLYTVDFHGDIGWVTYTDAVHFVDRV